MYQPRDAKQTFVSLSFFLWPIKLTKETEPLISRRQPNFPSKPRRYHQIDLIFCETKTKENGRWFTRIGERWRHTRWMNRINDGGCAADGKMTKNCSATRQNVTRTRNSKRLTLKTSNSTKRCNENSTKQKTKWLAERLKLVLGLDLI
jgi:hypothetical protein